MKKKKLLIIILIFFFILTLLIWSTPLFAENMIRNAQDEAAANLIKK